MSLFTPSLWPATVRRPYLRLALGMVVGPVFIAAFLTLAAFLIAGMSSPTREETMAATWEAAIVFVSVVVVFTLTFGAIGVMILWSLAQRGPFVWALIGAVLGALAGVSFTFMAFGRVEFPVLVAFVLCGWAMFLLIRWVAGIRDA